MHVQENNKMRKPPITHTQLVVNPPLPMELVGYIKCMEGSTTKLFYFDVGIGGNSDHIDRNKLHFWPHRILWRLWHILCWWECKVCLLDDDKTLVAYNKSFRCMVLQWTISRIVVGILVVTYNYGQPRVFL